MFLTTNPVFQFEVAILSGIHIVLKYEDLNDSDSVKEKFCKSLEFLGTFSRSYRTSQPEDKLYAPSAIATYLPSEVVPSNFLVPDYNKPVSQIYTEITGTIISETRRISPLDCRGQLRQAA